MMAKGRQSLNKQPQAIGGSDSQGHPRQISDNGVRRFRPMQGLINRD